MRYHFEPPHVRVWRSQWAQAWYWIAWVAVTDAARERSLRTRAKKGFYL
jgi:hypothetical protein